MYNTSNNYVDFVCKASILYSAGIWSSFHPQIMLSSSVTIFSSLFVCTFFSKMEPSPVLVERFWIISSETVFKSYAQPTYNQKWYDINEFIKNADYTYQSLQKDQLISRQHYSHSCPARRSCSPMEKHDGNYANLHHVQEMPPLHCQ